MAWLEADAPEARDPPRYIYLDGGLIPDHVFQLREQKTGLCMQVKRNDRQPHNVVLAACAGPHEEHQSSELQLFHRGNR
ncbi:unnamed protein product, partial [Symbiodinium microadriaticum]